MTEVIVVILIIIAIINFYIEKQLDFPGRSDGEGCRAELPLHHLPEA